MLERLHKAHPTHNMGKHIATALDGDLWGVSDKEFLLALQKYEINLDIDRHIDEDEIDEIIKDGMHLDRTFLEEEED